MIYALNVQTLIGIMSLEGVGDGKTGFTEILRLVKNRLVGKLTEHFAIKFNGKIILGYYEGNFMVHKKKIVIMKGENDIG